MFFTWLPLSVDAWLVHMVVYHGFGAGFLWCDRIAWLRILKVRRRVGGDYSDLLPQVLFNQCLVLLPCMVACQFLGLAFIGVPHVGLWHFLIFLVLMAIGHDVVQYLAHRFLLHHRRFRWLGHSVHHSTNASVAISACYMSGADFFLEIVCPYLVPLVLIGGGGRDVFFHCVVVGLGTFGGLYEHSGYDLAATFRSVETPQHSWRRWIPSAAVSSHAHGEHHRRSTVSFSDGFGSPGICDTLFRTRWNLR